MTEISQPQDGIAVGDAARAPYSATEWDDMFEALFSSGDSENPDAGVLFGYEEGLEARGAVSPVAVHTGGALVKGKWYRNDSDLTLAVAAIAANPRYDVVVLRSDFTLQTIRAAIVQGVEGGGIPALTQIDGTTWEIPLATLYVTAGAAAPYTVTDARQPIAPFSRYDFLPPLLGEIGAARVELDLTAAPLAGYDVGLECTVAGITTCMNRFVARQTDTELTVRPLVISEANGVLRYGYMFRNPACGEPQNTGAASAYVSSSALTLGNIYCLPGWDFSVEAGDIVMLNFRRDALHVDDTIAASVWFLGWFIE